MNRVPFFKMSGSGNDFIVVDNRRAKIEKAAVAPFIAAVCRRKLSVGSDGFILVEDAESADFRWHFYNSDGSRAEMCGNGARCVSRFAYVTGIAGREMTFETDAGMVTATLTGDKVKIGVPDPVDFQMAETVETSSGDISFCRVNTGVPHVVIEVGALDQIDVANLGKEIRYHTRFAPAGTNVNFVSILEESRVALRTYERGVEDETLACGTGAVAAAQIAAAKYGAASPITVTPRSGCDLTVYFDRRDDAIFDVFLEGDARIIYQAELWEDAWQDAG